jgi:hypothetical protein
LAGAFGFQALGEGWGLAGLPVAELGDHDHVFGAAWQPAVGIFGDRQVVWFSQFEDVLFTRLR